MTIVGGFGNRTARSFVSTPRMQDGRGLALVVTLAAAGTLAWSPPAAACGTVGLGAGMALAMLPSLLIVLLISLISLLSMRAAGRAVGRMRRHRDSRGLRVGHGAVLVGLGISVASTIVAGGLLFALVLLAY